MSKFLSKQSKTRIGIGGVLLVVVIGIVDYFTPSDFTTYVFYLIPVLLVAWFVGMWGGIWISVLSALVWLIANVPEKLPGLALAVQYWNALARLISFVVVALILSFLKNASVRLEREQFSARMDDLTRVANRRAFTEFAEQELERMRRYGHPLTVVYVDVDDFKSVNDRLGHHSGDFVLRSIAETLHQQVRVTDLVARLGGDEFAILMPETHQDHALAVLQRIQRILDSTIQNDAPKMTLSIGVVTFQNPPATVDELLNLADKQMYSAKQNGKNRIETRTIV